MAKRAPKQAGYSWICPALTVQDPGKAQAFYAKAFGFTPGQSVPGPDGKIMHAEVRHKDVTIMLGPEAMAQLCRTPAASKVEAPMALYVYVEDVDALCARAKQAGAVVRAAPNDAFWGDRFCQLVDPDGYVWWFATNVGEFDPAKAAQAAAK